MGDVRRLRQSSRAALCLSCGKCTTMCPLAVNGDFSARKVIQQEFEDLPATVTEAVVQCLTCASCEERCPQGVEFTEYVRGLRELIPPESFPPRPHGAFLDVTANMMRGAPMKETRPWWLVEGLAVAEEGEVGLFVGCAPAFDIYFGENLGVETVEIARSAIRLLNHVGIEPVVLSNERCCGHDQLWTGQREAFEELARTNTKAFNERGVKRLITACAECARTWRLDYPEVANGHTPKVEHMAEFLAASIREGKLQFEGNGGHRVTYQDPCRLGRHLESYDAPREVLAAIPGVVLNEMERSGRDAQCCGTPGFIHCNAQSKALQKRRLNEAHATGAERMLTACPKCLIHFACTCEEESRDGISLMAPPVEDLTVFAAEMLNSSRGEKSYEPLMVGRENGESR